MSELTQYHIQRLGALRGDRGNFNAQWEEGAALVLPSHRDSFLSGQGGVPAMQGQKKTESQFDATAALALMRFASVIESLATPQGSIWHGLAPVDKLLKRNRAVRMYFDDLNDALFAQRYSPKANFVGNSQQVYLGLGAYGNGIIFTDQPEQGKGLRYRNIHLGEAYFVENHAGIIDTLYRPFFLTATQVVQKYGAAAPESIQKAAAQPGQADNKYEILHCVYPRDGYDPGRLDAAGMPFASVTIAVGDQTVMRESGYATFPYGVSRYTQSPGELYGRGPTQFVLPSIKTLNQQKHDVLKQGHRILDPVLLSHDDGNLGSFSMKSGALNPGGMSKDGKPLVGVLPTGNLAVGDKMMEMERTLIHDAYLITLFQILVETPQMTATEVLERAREKGMLLAPTAGRMQAEFLGPLIERELDVLGRQGLLPPLPGVLQGQQGVEYTIEYTSPMSRMQRSEKAAGFMRALDVASAYAKNTQDMSPLDFFNFDTAMPEVLDIYGSPTAWTRTMEEVQQVRDGRAKQQEQQQMLQAAPAMASVVKGAPKQG